VEEMQQEVHLHRDKKLEELVQEALFKDLHRVKVVVQHSIWQHMIPPSSYHNLRERHRRTLRSTCSYVKISGKFSITLGNHALDCYMSLAANSPPRTTRMIVDIKNLLINKFYKPSSEDQYMNEMIEIK
jgi:hypothetical protein